MLPHSHSYFEDQILHSMNKSGYLYERVEAKELRQNVVLIGDIVEDTFMACPTKHTHILKVGFLNDMEKHHHLLENYMEAFDLVISGDGPLLPVNELLHYILEKELPDTEISESLAPIAYLRSLLSGA